MTTTTHELEITATLTINGEQWDDLPLAMRVTIESEPSDGITPGSVEIFESVPDYDATIDAVIDASSEFGLPHAAPTCKQIRDAVAEWISENHDRIIGEAIGHA
jgi:hypothetical protein